MNCEIVFNIISKLYECGFVVVALTSDMGPTNIGLWKKLGISIEKTSFYHPITKKYIHVFADPPHFLKLARNHFLDKYEKKLIFQLNYSLVNSLLSKL